MFTRIVWCSHAEWDFYTHSVIVTRRVLLSHAECYCHTKSVIVTRNMPECHFKSLECIFNTHKSDFYCNFYPHSVILHAECDFHTHECNFYTYECVNDTLAWDLHTQCNFNTPRCDFNTQNIGCYTQSTISIRKVRYPHAAWFYTQSVLSTLTRVITTRSSGINTRRV
jgi:hypothetical protein